MKIAVLSDIHGNVHGLKKCMEHALEQQVDRYLFLGDYVSDCAYPRETMDELYRIRQQYTCDFIRGNREEYLLNHHNGMEDGWISPSSASGSLMFTYQRLRQQDFDFFRQLPIAGRMSIEGYPEFHYCHGSMTKSKGTLIHQGRPKKELEIAGEVALYVSGHTHLQGVFQGDDTCVVNVGSVGVPWKYNGKTQYVILEGYSDHWKIHTYQLEYDRMSAIEGIYETGLGDQANIWAAIVRETLLTGEDHSMECLMLAMSKCQEELGTADWNHLPEKYWKEAALEILGFLHT